MKKYEYMVEYSTILCDAEALCALGAEGWRLSAVSDKLDIAVFVRCIGEK